MFAFFVYNLYTGYGYLYLTSLSSPEVFLFLYTTACLLISKLLKTPSLYDAWFFHLYLYVHSPSSWHCFKFSIIFYIAWRVKSSLWLPAYKSTTSIRLQCSLFFKQHELLWLSERVAFNFAGFAGLRSIWTVLTEGSHYVVTRPT